MSIFTKSIKKIKTGLSGLAARLPDRSDIRKGTKVAAIVSLAALLFKGGHTLYKKAGKTVEDDVAESKINALEEVRLTVKKSLEKFIFECVFRWIIYISLVMCAYILARAFNLRKDILVAFVILGIYSFYVIKTIRICGWYISFCRSNGLMFNPVRIIRAYLHKAVLDRVQRTREGLSLPARLAMNFFGPTSDKIARDITLRSMESAELRREAITRIGMWICGWIIYALVYEKLFLFVTDIDFKAIWEPMIWPFYMLVKVLSVQ